ncbi:MAG: hypothetical protein IPG75_22700 [Gemmatimonadetes bacterium]|nr:hypothetical protein [Gemmatimonadota bacterium]
MTTCAGNGPFPARLRRWGVIPGLGVAEVDRLQEERADGGAVLQGGAKRNDGTAASAAESSAGYPDDSAGRVESGVSLPVSSTKS